jgi:uncharacterized protein YukE
VYARSTVRIRKAFHLLKRDQKMLKDDKEFFLELSGSDPGQNSTVDRAFGNLMKGIYPGVDFFNLDQLEKSHEPDRFPNFNLWFLQSSSTGLMAAANSNNSAINPSFSNYARSSMTTIRVDPPVLQNSSQTIQSSATTLTSVGSNITSSANGAPSYDNQFAPKVHAIAAGASSQATQLSSTFSNLSGWLKNKAQQFLDADNAAAGELGSHLNDLSWAIPLGVFITPLTVLPFLSLLVKLFPNGINLWNTVPDNLVDSVSSPTTVLFSAVTTAGLNLRYQAGLGSSVIGNIKSGTMLQVIGFGIQTPDGMTWVRVRTTDGVNVGWVAEKYLTPLTPGIVGNNLTSSEEKINNPNQKIQEIADSIMKDTGGPNIPANGESLGDWKKSNNGKGDIEQCAVWAQQRWNDLNGTTLPHIGTYYNVNDLGANHYVDIFPNEVVKIDSNNVQKALDTVKTGSALIWGSGSNGIQNHIAIIEASDKNGVYISESNWGQWTRKTADGIIQPVKDNVLLDSDIYSTQGLVRYIPKEKLISLYILPPNAKAISPPAKPM